MSATSTFGRSMAQQLEAIGRWRLASASHELLVRVGICKHLLKVYKKENTTMIAANVGVRHLVNLSSSAVCREFRLIAARHAQNASIEQSPVMTALETKA
jgi:hypothetical protein